MDLARASRTLSFYLNGTPIDLHNANPRWTLLDFIRSQDGLKGTKLGCGEGGCGACTVVLQTRDAHRLCHNAVNACLYPLIGVSGKHVITVEGLGSVEHPHPLQDRIARLHGSQCGFCTPGIVMSLYALVRNAYDPQTGQFRLSADDIERKGHLDGNLCRCTGYKPILEAARTFITEDLAGNLYIQPPTLPDEAGGDGDANSGNEGAPSGSCGRPGGCCRDSPNSSCASNTASSSSLTPPPASASSSPTSASSASPPTKQFAFLPYTPNTELIFPPSLAKFTPRLLYYGDETQAWARPTSVDETLAILAQHPSATLVTGASEVQVDVRFKGLQPSLCVFIGDIPELTSITWSPDQSTLQVGGSASLTALENECLRLIPTCVSQSRASVLAAIAKTLRYFAGRQVRNAASLAGNIATASPISDMNPLLVALKATVQVRSPGSEEETTISMATMFQGYRRTALPPASLITRIDIPVPPETDETTTIELTNAYKQSKRKDDDIAIVTAAFRVRLASDNNTITDISIVYGGMAPTTILATKTAKALLNKPWDDKETLHEALASLSDELPLPYSVPGGMASYRRTLTLSLFVRFWHYVLHRISQQPFPCLSPTPASSSPCNPSQAPGETSTCLVENEIHRAISTGKRDHTNPYVQRVVGQEIPHLSGLRHATGQAEYIDDMPPLHRELHGALVLSERAHARIVEVDWAPALEGGLAVGYVDWKDLSPPSSVSAGHGGEAGGEDQENRNVWGSVIHDEPIFAENTVHSHGQIIGLVYAETAIQAQQAARRVRVVYEDLPAIITIDEAIEAGSFFPYGKELRRGLDPSVMSVPKGSGSDEEKQNDKRRMKEAMDAVFDKECDVVLEGTSRIGGQEHFYLETQAAIAVPCVEDGSMDVWSSTQNTMETQDFVSQVTSVPRHKINVKVRRMGGAFGGKESRSVPIACAVALAAQKTRRPVRIMLNRDEDMMTSGQRHPMQCRWKIGCNREGKLIALAADCYNNAGFSVDLSMAVMDRCCTSLDNCYYIPYVHIRGWVCRTNTHSNTAFRGFGAPQAMFMMESMMSAVAERLGMSVDEVRMKNLYEVGQRTPFLQVIDDDWHIPMMMAQMKEEARYEERRQAVDEFNARNRWRKRGICLIPTKFGISFATALHLNQAGATVRLYTDGSVLLNHGGTEMGQGLYTKMVQVAAQALGVSVDQVYTQDTSSFQTANASPTAASSGSDLNGMAVQHACDQLNERLRPYREKLGADASLASIAKAAYRDRVSLMAQGFWKIPSIGYEWGNYDPETVKPMYFYFTQGVACTEIELDILTGTHTVLRTDIKMDVGRSINPAIDYGQIEGAFIQGQGLFTMEESLWTREGQLATRGPGNYKIPGFADIPQEFNVSFLQGVSWRTLRSIQSSKGIGEPPLFLGATVLFALRDALQSARKDQGIVEPLMLDSPATTEKVRLAMGDELVKMGVVEAGVGEKEFFQSVA